MVVVVLTILVALAAVNIVEIVVVVAVIVAVAVFRKNVEGERNIHKQEEKDEERNKLSKKEN